MEEGGKRRTAGLVAERRRLVAVDVAPVADAVHPYQPGGVVDGVQDSVVALADAPPVLHADELFRAGQARIHGQVVDRVDQPLANVAGQIRELAPGGVAYLDFVATRWGRTRWGCCG